MRHHEPNAISRRGVLQGLSVLGAGLVVPGLLPTGAAAAPTVTPATGLHPAVKTRATYYTAAKVEAARRNVSAYGWAHQLRDGAVARAARLVEQDDGWIWSAITSQGLPRSYAVNQTLGSPITGRDYYKYGAYSWIGDPYARPWKLTDPSSGYVFPTNDFPAFYRSGLDERGEFDRSRADESLLVNQLYPERGPSWGVDDGLGWVDENGDRWTFVAYYNHWFVWGYNNFSAGGLALVSSALQAARDAYVYTGDLAYAHAGLIMLDRIADVYPRLHTGEWDREDGYLASDGHTRRGKAVGKIWEAFLAQHLCTAYDAFFPAIGDDDAAGVVPFLAAKAEQHGLPPKGTAADVRANIENGILRVIYPEVKAANIHGNFGMHQSALALAAVVLDHAPETQEWIDFTFQAGGFAGTGDADWHVTGGNVEATLVNDVDRDGWGYESPGYNELWIDQITQVADVLEGYDGYDGADLYQHPKFKAMVLARPSLTVQGTFTPAIGDSHQVAVPGLLGTAAKYAAGFLRYPNVPLAQAAYQLNGNSADGLNGGIFMENPEKLAADIQAAVDANGPLDLPTDNLTGYGAAFFRNGLTGPACLLYYGAQYAHGQRNALYVDLWSHGLNLAGSLGYPEFANSSALTVEWNQNTVAANTVVVDASPQRFVLHNEGQPHNWVDTPEVKVADVSAPTVYDVDQYRRTTAQIRVGDMDSYYVDLFRVDGGSEHVYSFHGVSTTADVTGVALIKQDGGSYAGPTVEPPADSAPSDRSASGYAWLSNVSRGAPEGAFSVDWPILDPYDLKQPDEPIHLRLTMLSDVDELALADGRTPRNKKGNPNPLRYMLARRTGTDLSSRFVSVIEPYNGAPLVASARTVPVEVTEGTLADGAATAVRIELADGRVDYVVSCLDPTVQLKVDGHFLFRGAFGFLRQRGSATELTVTSDSTQLVPVVGRADGVVRAMSAEHGAVSGRLTSFSRDLLEESTLLITPDTPVGDPAGLVGRYVYVANDGVRNAAYRITSARLSGGELELRVRGTTVRSFADDQDAGAGYVYDVAVGARASVPLTRRWTA